MPPPPLFVAVHRQTARFARDAASAVVDSVEALVDPDPDTAVSRFEKVENALAEAGKLTSRLPRLLEFVEPVLVKGLAPAEVARQHTTDLALSFPEIREIVQTDPGVLFRTSSAYPVDFQCCDGA